MELTLRHIDNPPPGFKEYVSEKVSHLSRFGVNIDRITLVAGDEHTHDLDRRYSMEIVVMSRGQRFVAKAAGPNLNVAADDAVARLSRQIVKHKERRKERT